MNTFLSFALNFLISETFLWILDPGIPWGLCFHYIIVTHFNRILQTSVLIKTPFVKLFKTCKVNLFVHPCDILDELIYMKILTFYITTTIHFIYRGWRRVGVNHLKKKSILKIRTDYVSRLYLCFSVCAQCEELHFFYFQLPF